MADESTASCPLLKRSFSSAHDSSQNEILLCCFLCCRIVINPKTLSCNHIFCETCLLNRAKDKCLVKCPTCLVVTQIPSTGVATLRSSTDNPVIQRKVSAISNEGLCRCDICIYKSHIEESAYFCPKCSLNFCVSCRDIHQQQEIFQKHICLRISSKEVTSMVCRAHNNRQMSHFFCQDCQQPICNVCIMTSHCGHNVLKLQDVLLNRTDTITALLKELKPILDKMEHCFDQYLSKRGNKSVQYDESLTSDESDDPIIPEELKDQLAKVNQCNRFFSMTLKALNMSQSKSLILVSDDIILRLKSILSEELTPELVASVENSQMLECQGADEEEELRACVSSHLPKLLQKPHLIWKIEKQPNEVGEVWNPCAVTFLPDGCTIVAEYDILNDNHNRLRVFSADGKPVSIIGQGKIRPLGVTVSQSGRIFVTDCENKRVKIFSICGSIVGEIGKGQFGWPYGVALNSMGQVIVSDAFNDTISIFGGDGKLLKQFGSSGSGVNQLRNPYHITVDAKDRIIVADSGNNKVKIFDAEGQYLREASFHRSTLEKMTQQKKKKVKAPRGVAVDMHQNLLVSDDHCRVAMFNPDCVFQQNLLTFDDGVKYPEAIATNCDGRLAVTEWNPNQMFAVKVFNMYG